MSSKIVFTIIISLVSFSIYAQSGIFRTYDDYLNDKVEIEFVDGTTSHAVGNFKVSFVDSSGNKTKYKVDNKAFWGYKVGDKIYRVDGKHQPYWLIEKGVICVYVSYNSRYQLGGSFVEIKANQFSPKMSFGIKEEMVDVNKKNLKKIMSNNPDWAKRAKACSFGFEPLFSLIVNYNYFESK